MGQLVLLLLILYAACGLMLSLAAHLLALAGHPPGGNALFFALHIGIFPLWIPVVLISMKMMNGVRRQDYWEVALAGCPPWMKYMTYGFFAYAVINFAIFVILVPKGKPPVGGAPPPEVWHGFSGHWMLFYSAGLAILTGVYLRGGFGNLQQRCPFGHEVAFGDQYCATCGAKVEQPVLNQGS
jgi:hypothetical protein